MEWPLTAAAVVVLIVHAIPIAQPDGSGWLARSREGC